MMAAGINIGACKRFADLIILTTIHLITIGISEASKGKKSFRWNIINIHFFQKIMMQRDDYGKVNFS